MTKINPNISLAKYKFHEFMTLYDSYSKVDRVLYYRLGWQVFYNHDKSFEEYTEFILKKNVYKFFIWDVPFISIISLISLLTIYVIRMGSQINWWVLIVTLFFILVFFIIYLGLPNSTKNNRDQSRKFFEFINNKNKKSNFNYFNALELDDKASSKILFDHFKINQDIQSTNEISSNYDKTVKLLALDFLLGLPGTLREHINLLNAKSVIKLSKSGIYKVLAVLIGANSDNIKSMVESNELIDIRNNTSNTREEQLLKVKEIFKEAKLSLLVNEVDKVLEKMN